MKLGPYDPVDETTTNIYVGNINPKVCVLLFFFNNLIKLKKNIAVN